MKDLIITINSLNNIDVYKDADSFLIGNEKFAVRLAKSFTSNEICEAVKHAHSLNKKIYINVNKIFLENEIRDLKDYMVFLKSINVDAIFFSDFAVFTIAKDLEILDRLVYYSETQMVNYMDANTLIDLKIKGVIISKEVTLDNIYTFAAKVKKGSLGVNIYGYYHMFYSKRKLIRNYFLNYQKDYSKYISNKKITIKEKTRQELYPIFQDENGTNIFNDEILLGIDYINSFIDKGIKMFIIDGIFEEEDYMQSILEYFVLALKNPNSKYSTLIKNKYPFKKYGAAFYFKKIGITS
ncbi:MAG: U32 family peptidase [Bacilli bacterium]|nr:U32 family peptidase [Bacilli bacterium]